MNRLISKYLNGNKFSKIKLDLNFINLKCNQYADDGSIYIDPSKRGTFTAAATKHGMGVQEFASKVLANKDNYSPAMVKKANFAKNASKWNHSSGGYLFKEGEPKLISAKSKQAPWYSELDEAVLGEVMQQFRNIVHPANMEHVSYKTDVRGKKGGTAQRTYLLPRFEQEDIFLRDGYIKGKEGDYGLVKKAVNNRNLPVWQTKPDAINRETLVPIGNTYGMDSNGYINRDKDLVHAESHPAAFYVDGSTGKLYTKGWDLNDYGGTGGGQSSNYNILKKAGANILDFIGSPVVVTTGFQEVTNPWGGASKHLNRGATIQDLFDYDDERYPIKSNLGKLLDTTMNKQGLYRENIDGKWVYSLPEVTITGKRINKKADGGRITHVDTVRMNDSGIFFDENGNIIGDSVVLPELAIRPTTPQTNDKAYYQKWLMRQADRGGRNMSSSDREAYDKMMQRIANQNEVKNFTGFDGAVYNHGSGALEQVSPEFDALTLGRQFYTDGLFNGISKGINKKVSKGTSEPLHFTLWTPEQWTAAQDAAIARGNMTEAQRLRDLHFQVSAPNTKVKKAVFNGSLSDKPFYEFNTDFRDAYWGGRNDYTTGAWFGTGDENTMLSFAGDNPNRLRRFYLNFNNPFIKDAGHRRWDKLLPFDMTEKDIAIEAAKLREKGFPEYVIEDWKKGLNTTTDNYALKLETTNYDSGIIKNVYENKAYPNSDYGVITDYIASKPNQIKLADAVTYDNNGVRIPLGLRDNFRSKDIRYGLIPLSIGGKYLHDKVNNNKLKQ